MPLVVAIFPAAVGDGEQATIGIVRQPHKRALTSTSRTPTLLGTPAHSCTKGAGSLSTRAGVVRACHRIASLFVCFYRDELAGRLAVTAQAKSLQNARPDRRSFGFWRERPVRLLALTLACCLIALGSYVRLPL